MKFIARDTDYAIRALMFMGKKSRQKIKTSVTIDEIVNNLGLSERFMRKTLQRLVKNKILSSHKGRHGGFSFLKSPFQIKVTDIITIFQGRVDLTNCVIRGRLCPNIKRCPLRKRLRRISKLVAKELRKITIISLL